MRLNRVCVVAAVLTQGVFLAIWWVLVTGPLSGENLTPASALPPAFVLALMYVLAFPGECLAYLVITPLKGHVLLIAAVNVVFWYAVFALVARLFRRRSHPGRLPASA